jgi:predicted nucleic acid-binding protein
MLLPPVAAVAFGPDEANLASELYTSVRRSRGREIDLAIAACAITHHAALWTLNVADFEDLPALRLV